MPHAGFGDDFQGGGLGCGLEIADADAKQDAGEQKDQRRLGESERDETASGEDERRVDDVVCALPVENFSGDGARHEDDGRVEQKEETGGVHHIQFAGVEGKKGLQRAITNRDQQHHQRQRNHLEIEVVMQVKGGCGARVFDAIGHRVRGDFQGHRGEQADDAEAGTEQKNEPVGKILHQQHPQKRAKGKGQDGAQTEIADALPDLIGRDEVGDQGRGDRADAAHANAAQKAHPHQRGQVIRREVEQHAGGVDYDADEQDFAESDTMQNAPRGKTPRQTADQHQTGNQPCGTGRGVEVFVRVWPADNEQEVISHHDHKINHGDDDETAGENHGHPKKEARSEQVMR